jgi:capsule polysaccharide export protein KpsC/LpsZ
VSSGRKGGYLTRVQPGPRTVLLREAVNPLGLIQQMDRVYVVTSTMGFEALLAVHQGAQATSRDSPVYILAWMGTT